MAKKITEEIKNTNTNEQQEQLQKQLKEEKNKNIELENKLTGLESMIKELIEQTKKQNEAKEVVKETKKSALESYKSIDPNKRLLLINMIDAGGTYITHSGKPVRFDRPGQVMPAKFEDVESLRNKYRSSFENLEIRIVDDEDAINALYLKPFYDKYQITFEDLENMINLDPQEMIKKLKSLPKSLQESALSMIISGVARTDIKYMDKNKWALIKNEFNINIEELSSTYFVEQ